MLNTFEAQPLSDEEGNANNLEEEAATFSIKYLTSSKLMGLEVRNSEKCWWIKFFLQRSCFRFLVDPLGSINFFFLFFFFSFTSVERPKFSTPYSCSMPHIVWLSEGTDVHLLVFFIMCTFQRGYCFIVNYVTWWCKFEFCMFEQG